ncbi:hypothetical protein GF371_03350 [Candidatus Woesearchaeota archaeon]|nr:hypothetical protein [Candidatus Woesearchaeota archaeon]
MDNRLITALLIIALFYFIYKTFFLRFKTNVQKYPDEIEEVINSEKYKVKGQFDQ